MTNKIALHSPPSTPVITYYLEMTSPRQVIESSASNGLHVVEAMVKQYPLNRFLFEFIGRAWGWIDKLEWTDQQWQEYAESDNLRTWVAYIKGSPAGYYELLRVDNCVEIAYFGLAETFIGKGYGAFLLTQAARCAWAWGHTQRVWVHTCTKDHPNALPNYQARGFTVYRKEVGGLLTQHGNVAGH